NVERHERALPIHRHLAHHGEVFGERRIDSEIHADRSDGGVVANTKAWCDRTRARDEILQRRDPAAEGIEDALADGGSVDEDRATEILDEGQWEAVLHTPLQQRRPTEWPRRELVVAHQRPVTGRVT